LKREIKEKKSFAIERLEKFAVKLRFDSEIPKEMHPIIEK